ncbi:MAG TPA: FHA domain-containing protein, partial [Gammaproteobacteria bacterium]|nr:FHA domain-containing protein [Gammaproteobacteria bacterium]
MGKLILTLDGQELAQYELEKERYTIGRLADNDIHIDNMAVSGHHALIINILKDSFLEDLNSTNGTYVNGKLIKKHALQEGDVITIGRHALKYMSGKPAAAAGDADDFEKTMIIRPGTKSQTGVPSMDSVNKAISEAGGAPIADGAKAAALPRAKLQVLSGSFAGKELELNKALTTLGRPGVQVAAVTRRADGFFVVHVESGQGHGFPTVNGSDIGAQALKLKDNDVIELAGVKMGFYEMK